MEETGKWKLMTPHDPMTLLSVLASPSSGWYGAPHSSAQKELCNIPFRSVCHFFWREDLTMIRGREYLHFIEPVNFMKSEQAQ